MQQEDSTAIWWTIIWTLIYGILFLPLLFFFGIWTFVIFEGGFAWIKIIPVFVSLCISFSLLASIYLMRRYLNCGRYDMTYFAGCIPWMVVGAILLIDYLLCGLQNLWKDLFAFPWHASGTPITCIPQLFSALGN